MRESKELSESEKLFKSKANAFMASVDNIRAELGNSILYRSYLYQELERILSSLVFGAVLFNSPEIFKNFILSGHALFQSLTIPSDSSLKKCEEAYAEVANFLNAEYKLELPEYKISPILSFTSSSSSSSSSFSSTSGFSSSSLSSSSSSRILYKRPTRGLYDLDILIHSFAASYFALSIVPMDSFLPDSVPKIELMKEMIEVMGQQLIYETWLIKEEKYSQAGIQNHINALKEFKKLFTEFKIPEFLLPLQAESEQAFLDDIDDYIESIDKMDFSHLPKTLTEREKVLDKAGTGGCIDFHKQVRSFHERHGAVKSGKITVETAPPHSTVLKPAHYQPESSSNFFDGKPVLKQHSLSQIKGLAVGLKISQLLEAVENPGNAPLLKEIASAKAVFLALASTLELKNIKTLQTGEAEICLVLGKLFEICPALKKKEEIDVFMKGIESLQISSKAISPKESLEVLEDAEWEELDKGADEDWGDEAVEGQKSSPTEAQAKPLSEIVNLLLTALRSSSPSLK